MSRSDFRSASANVMPRVEISVGIKPVNTIVMPIALVPSRYTLSFRVTSESGFVSFG
jgi:hypothetical protein